VKYVHRDEHMAIGAVENVLMVGWLGPPGLTSAVALERTSKELAPKYPQGIAHFNVVAKTSSATSFEDAARKRIIGLLHDRTVPLVASVTVYGDGGFVAATIRGVLASLTMLTRTPVKIRFVGRMEDAESFILDTLRAAKVSAPAPGLLAAAAHSIIDDAVRDGFAF
jgi:hypothetical protein